jgi:hypothetical protein
LANIGFKENVQRYKLNPSEIIYVGDEDRDIIACQKVKIKNMAVCWGYNAENRLRAVAPDFIVNSPVEILNILVANFQHLAICDFWHINRCYYFYNDAYSNNCRKKFN